MITKIDCLFNCFIKKNGINTKKLGIVQQTLLRVPNDDEALEHFTKTKTGEPSRMGSN